MESNLIRNVDQIKQVLDFSGLQLGGGRYPMDIDGFLDWQGRQFIFIEVKYGDTALPRGQELAYERLCDTCVAGHVNSVVLVAQHHSEDLSQPIDCAELQVTKVRYQGGWHDINGPLTMREAMDRFLKNG